VLSHKSPLVVWTGRLKIATEPSNWQFQAEDFTQSIIGAVLLFFTGP